jgi:hypothetical protein
MGCSHQSVVPGLARVRSGWVGRIFATLVRGQLVVKLPRSRVYELVSAGEGVRFDANKVS